MKAFVIGSNTGSGKNNFPALRLSMWTLNIYLTTEILAFRALQTTPVICALVRVAGTAGMLLGSGVSSMEVVCQQFCTF